MDGISKLNVKVNTALPTNYSWQNSLDAKEKELLSFAEKSISDTIKALYAKNAFAQNRIRLKSFVQPEV